VVYFLFTIIIGQLEIKSVPTKRGKTISDVRQKLIDKLGNMINSIVIYGSVARGDARDDSDIDIFVVIKDHDLFRSVSDIGYSVDMKNRTHTSYFWATPREVIRMAKNHSPFIDGVAAEGIVLYDRGTFRRLRKRLAAKSRQSA
jgi:predicted nucleotidyltransferase